MSDFIAPTRPIDPTAKPVHLPLKFATYGSVISFYQKNKLALTWDQVDTLVRTHDRLKAEQS